MLDAISSGLAAPTNSALGIAAATVDPVVSYKIGQYFKANDQEGSAQHILAHAVLGAAVAAAGGNNALTAALSAGGAEAAAPVLANYLYGKSGKDLNSDEKATVSAIAGLVATGVGATTGSVASTVQAGQVAQNAVEDNYLTPKGFKSGYKVFEADLVSCKSKGQDCSPVIEKYWKEHEANHATLQETCGSGGITCPAWEEVLSADLATAEKLADPDARKVAVMMVSADLATASANISIVDRVVANLSPEALAALVIARKVPTSLMTQEVALNALKNAGIASAMGMTTEALMQELANGTINYKDVIAAGISSAINSSTSITSSSMAGKTSKVGDPPPNLSPLGAGRSGAFNQAKRDAGIPVSMQPSEVLPNTDKRGNIQPGKQYVYEIAKPGGGTQAVVIRDDSNGHIFVDNPSQNRGPHFNTPKGDHYDY